MRDLLHHHHGFLVALRASPKIVITKLHGVVAGAGLSLAFLGDLAVAADDARFVPGYAKLGTSPDGGGTIGVVEKIGPGRALQLFLATDALSAKQAEAIGLLDGIEPATTLDDRVRDLAARFASRAPMAIAETKRLVCQRDDGALANRLHAEQEALIQCMETNEFVQALGRFTDRRVFPRSDAGLL